MSHKKLRPFIVKVTVFVTFPYFFPDNLSRTVFYMVLFSTTWIFYTFIHFIHTFLYIFLTELIFHVSQPYISIDNTSEL